MKKLFLLTCLFYLAGCTTQTNTLVGNDQDMHACKGSAGYTFSKIKNKCVRLWEEGKKLLPVQQTKDAVFAAYVITDNDNAEVFLPQTKGPLQMIAVYKEEATKWEASDGSGWNLVEDAFGEWGLYQNDTLLFSTRAGKI